MMTILDETRLRAAKLSYAVRHVPMSDLRVIDDAPRAPRAGDVVLARIVTLGKLGRLENPNGRRAELFEGDEVILAYGNRYAPDAYEAETPRDLSECDLAAAGGLASRVINTNAIFAGEDSPPTRIQPLGVFMGADGLPVNLEDYAIRPAAARRAIPVICVFGASMNAGKTTTAASIMHGLARQGRVVGAAKVTGTCAGGDLWTFRDHGAVETVDFTDAGHATTYLADVDRLAAQAHDLVGTLQARGCDVAVIEVADGIFQRETSALLRHRVFRQLVDHWVFAAESAPGILSGWQYARELDIPLAVMSGAVTASPLAMREASRFVSVPLANIGTLREGVLQAGWLRNASSGTIAADLMHPGGEDFGFSLQTRAAS
jgi:hypothetical protein